MKKLTPAHMRCDLGASCPEALQLDDGRLLIVGKAASLDKVAAQMIGPYVGKLPVAWDEHAIVISPDLLSDYVAALKGEQT